MKLEGIHHVTAITADAQDNVDFYAGVLGLRLVKKTVNQDDPSVYHVFYSDEEGQPGSDITFFEFPGAPLGRAGDGMVHTIVWRVASADALDFWERRLGDNGISVERDGDSLRFADPEGLAHELTVSDVGDRRSSPSTPRSPPSSRCRASRRCAPTPPLPRRASGCSASSASRAVRGAGRRGAGAAAAGSTTTSRPSSAASRAPGPSITSPGHRRPRSTSSGARRWSAAAAGRPRSSTASTSSRSTSASRAACCSRSRRSVPASPSTSPPSISGEKLSLPPDFEHLRPQVEANLRPITSPRQRAVS